MARERRSRKELIMAKMEALDEKITGYANKIAELTNQKEELQNELEIILDAEKKAEAEAQEKEMLKLIKAQKITVEELKQLLENR
ncbi:MAG: hypothetical protein LIO94_01400 [Clostridiales bacterium]|nr:hypothetical protein [Clostridiales bacterium]